MGNALLEVEGLFKRFQGIVASDNIQLDVSEGELHAIIGPNGAGKTTLISQLAGELTPNSGWIRFAGRDITALPAYRRSALGLARSFQITSLFPDFTALDNVALAVQAHAGHSFRFWRDARRDPQLREPARATLARVGLDGRADVLASKLSHGEHRQLEIAMALATSPRMLLLDEPMAGLGPEESRRMHELMRSSRAASPSCWSSTTWRPCSRLPIASPCWSRAAPSHRVRRKRSGAIARCSAPISETRRPPHRPGDGWRDSNQHRRSGFATSWRPE